MPTIDVKDAGNVTRTIQSLPAVGAAAAAASLPVTVATDQAPVPVTAGTPATATGTIASGQSLSGTITLTGEVTAILMPAAWTSAVLSFQASIDGTNFFNMFTEGGSELTVIAGASQFVTLSNTNGFRGVRSIRIRSGTSAAPVNQGAARTMTVRTVGV